MNWLRVRLTPIMVTIIVTLTLITLISFLLLNKQTTSDPGFHQSYIIRLTHLLILILIYGHTLHRISHIEYSYIHLSWTLIHYLTHSSSLWYFLISNKIMFSNFCLYFSYHAVHIPIQLHSFPPSTEFLKLPNISPCFGFVIKSPHILSVGQYLICKFSY